MMQKSAQVIGKNNGRTRAVAVEILLIRRLRDPARKEHEGRPPESRCVLSVEACRQHNPTILLV